jgi:CDP-glycerol glycerophosphotransferase (TagB/SpsB family)
MIRTLLDTGYHIIVRPHPQSYSSEKEMLENLQAKFPNSEQLEWNRDNDNFEVLRRSDIMISDFSGVVFDFALVFDRPVIYADVSFDKGVYDASWLEEELWTYEILPKIGVQLTE